jgi:hypothetical protein
MSEKAIPMTCAQFEEILHDLDRPGTPGLALREDALVHAETCSDCALLLIESESLDFGLHTLALRDEDPHASPVVEAALLREFHAATPSFMTFVTSITKGRVVRWQVAVIGIAALALFALGILRGRVGSKPGQPAIETATTSGANEQYALESDPQLNELAGSEDGTAFVSLPYADGDTSSLEGGAVVRVVMPRSALASLGLPVSGATGTDQIPAELIVSEDGTPQAIRLVSPATND